MRTDMSPQAVTVRLKRVSQLREMSLRLAKGKFVKPAEPSSNASAEQRDR